MDFKIPFMYSVNEIPPRCRKPRWVDKKGETTVSVREVAVSDLKPAFIVRDYEKNIAIYSYDDELYKIATRNFGNGDEVVRIEWLENTINRLSNNFYGTKTIPEIFAEMRETTERYLIVGDRVYEKTGEPRYCVYTFGLGHNHGGTCLSVDFHYNENIPASRYFDALHYDTAVQNAYDIAIRRGDTESLAHFRNRDYIDVLDSSFVRCRPKQQHGNGNAILQNFEDIITNSASVEDAAIAVMANAIT